MDSNQTDGKLNYRYLSGAISPDHDISYSSRLILPNHVDARMEDIFQQSTAVQVATPNWSDVTKLLAHLMELMRTSRDFKTGCWYKWFEHQLDKNAFVHGLFEEYLLDTLSYIAGNERRLSAVTWLSLIDYSPSYVENAISNKALLHKLETLVKDNSCLKESNYMSQWLQRPDGYMDMLCFGKLVFGTSDTSIKPILKN